jgi:uncharacterized caspase-like protein
MHFMSIRIFLALIVFIIFCSSPLLAATEQRIALVIGNGSYSSSPLKNPVNDATDMAVMLKKLGFDVILKKNVTHRPMEEAIRDFGNRLKRQKGVGLFFYAGHGLQANNMNYLIPIGAKIEKETDIQFEAVNAERVLAEMADADNGLNIVILDACRDNPFRGLFRSANRGLAVVSNAPTGTFISYSTAANQVARDGSRRNSPYTAALLKHIGEPGLSINDVFMKVRQNVRKSTGQTPWELSSLEGNFYFNQGQAVKIAEKETATASKDEVQEEASADLENEQQKIVAEREKLRQEKELFEQRKALAEEQRKLEEERKQLAMAKRPSVPTANEIRKDGRFIAYDNGTVLDTRTNLMWAAKDNGMVDTVYEGINWSEARSYCENHRGGGYTDWRMPTHRELAGLFDSNKSRTAKCDARGMVRITELIELNCWYVWGSETSSTFLVGDTGAVFNFNSGILEWAPQRIGHYQALPVRSAK